jgi:hypothetical protein
MQCVENFRVFSVKYTKYQASKKKSVATYVGLWNDTDR